MECTWSPSTTPTRNIWLYDQTAGQGDIWWQPPWWWTGFNDISAEGQWVWEDGAAQTFTSWGEGEPNNVDGGEDCGNIGQFQPYMWNDETCDEPASYICESSTPIARYTKFFGGLKTNPNLLHVVTIAGPAAPITFLPTGVTARD